MYKENYIHLAPMCFLFLFLLSIETLSQESDTSEKDMRNMPSLQLLRAGSLTPCIKDLKIKLKGKSTGKIKLSELRYAKGFRSRESHFSLMYTSAFL